MPTEQLSLEQLSVSRLRLIGCQRGSYGENCVSSCPDNCLSNLCELVTGNCFQCDAGYKGPRCDMECNGSVYGHDCGNTCGSCINDTQCHHINGSCLQGCGPGYKGDKCTEECPLGTYGNDCKYNCGIACSVSNHCNKTTGECIGGCKPGWKIFFCNQTYYYFFRKPTNVTVVRMDRTAVTCVDPVSTTHSVTMSTVAVYRGVVLGTREISVQKNVLLENMESTASSTVVLHAMRWTAVAKQQENALEYANPDGKEFSVSENVMVVCMDRTVVLLVDLVSTTPSTSVTTSMGFVQRDVLLGITDLGVTKKT
uniref:Cell death abnormality protein 1-like n=1 Tax=Crassostrea virginica TaxID=6565 RepID=A0A8B8BD92_CRAVI|nr:cell death abnormality protein 1-like [Crassostrea virginica]